MRRPLLLAILALCCAMAPARAAGVRARVVADGLDLFIEPSGSSYSVGMLHEGDTIQILREEQGGWLAIEPPEGAFVWVDAADLEILDDQRALVNATRVPARAGRPGVRLPGPPMALLAEGTSLTFLPDVSPLRLRARSGPVVLRAAAVPPGLRYYVRADGVQREDGTRRRSAARPAEPPEAPRSSLPTALATLGPPIDATQLGPSEVSMLHAIESEHRSVLRQPIDRWQLERIRVGYQDLRARVTEPQAAAAIDARLALVERQSTAANAARALERRLAQSRDLDRSLGEAEQAISAMLPDVKTPFDAVGLVQPSSKLVDGNRVFALVGADGRTIAYLRFPPGVLRDQNTAQRVGIRGSSRYDDTLQARIIDVRELESLGQIP